MRNDTIKSQRRQNNVKLIDTSKSDSILSPISDKRYVSSYSKDLLENTRKYLEMSNGNSNNLFSPVKTINDYNDLSSSPILSENYNFAKKYNEVMNYNNFNSNYLQYEFDNANDNNGNERFDKVKDEYIEYLQNQLEENNKNVIRLESKLNELQRRFKNLIDDNRLLNDTLNERNSKLNEYIQENENLRLQINNYIDNETKYRMQIQYCEKQIGLYENNINDYNNIIKDLKNSNETLTNNLTQSLDNKKNSRNNGSNTNNNFNNYNYFNVRNVTSDNEGELQFLKNQNMIYMNNIKSKDYTIDFVQKKNEKLMNENKLFRIQIDQYIQQITSLYTILKQSNKIINLFKQRGGIKDNSLLKELDKLEELNINFMNNTLNNNNEENLDDENDDMERESTWYNKNNISRGINPSIDKLMTDNEENKKRIEILNNKIRSLNDPNQSVQNYTEYMKSNNNNTVKVVRASKRESSKENGLINKPEKHQIGLHKDDNISGEQSRVNNFGKNKKEEEKQNNVKEDRKRTRFNKIEETNVKNSEDKNQTNKKEEEEKADANKPDKAKKSIKFKGVLEEKDKDKDDIKVEVVEPEVERKRSNSSGPKSKKKITIADAIDITVINTALPVVSQNLSFSMDDIEFFKNLQKSSVNSIYLFGIDRNDDFHTFDLVNKKFSKKKILEIEDISDTFKKDYQYDGTILYNTFDGLFILTGKKSDMLYYYNPKYDTINKICQFNNSHDNGSLLLDKEFNRLFVFGGKETTKCEYYSFNDKKLYDMPDLTIDRANGAFIICNNKIYGFFGFTYKNNKFCGNIEYIDHKKLDKWTEVQDINILNDKISFEVESVSTINYKENKDKILIYAGIQGDNEDYVTDYYYLYDTKENSIDLVEKWENRILRYTGSRWRNSNLTKKDPSGFHFAKNSNFLRLPKSVNIEGYEDDLYLLMDYKNNVHFINQDQKAIDIYKGDVL